MRKVNEIRSKFLFIAMFIIGTIGVIYQNCGQIQPEETSYDQSGNQNFETMTIACKMDVDGNGLIEENDHEKLAFLMKQQMIPDQVKIKFDSNNDGILDERDLDYYNSNKGDACASSSM